MQPAEITLLYQRIIKDEADIAELSKRPIPTDYSSVIISYNQRLLSIEEKLRAYELVLKAHGEQIRTLVPPPPIKWFNWKFDK